MKKTTVYILLFTTLLVAACNNKECAVSIEGKNIAVSAVPTEECSPLLKELLKKGESAVDSIKSPVIGTASMTLTAYPPESPLMNFAADALLSEAKEHCKKHIDIAITNKGGLRSELHEGVITFGDVYNVFPFENTLVVLTLRGEQLEKLFNDIASVGGEAISGARLSITPDEDSYRLADATVGGRPIEKNKEYTIATSDYLAQGNDKLYTLAEGYNRDIYTITIRELMINHIAKLHKKEKSVSAKEDGRIKKLIP